MTKCCQRTSGDFAAEGCHRRRFPVDYRNHEKTYVPATSGNEDSIHNLEADSQADPPANRTRSGHGDQDTLADVHPVEPSSGADLPETHAIVEEASHHDSVRAEATTANLKCGDILVADRAYTDFKFLCSLAGFPAVRRRTNGTARVEKPAFSGLSGIAMKNGGVYRSSAYSRTQVATRIFEHYELTPMRSGMVVKKIL